MKLIFGNTTYDLTYGEYDLEQRVYLPRPLRYLPFGFGYEVSSRFVLKVSHEAAERMAKVHGAEKNEAGWPIETVIVKHQEGKSGKERR